MNGLKRDQLFVSIQRNFMKIIESEISLSAIRFGVFAIARRAVRFYCSDTSVQFDDGSFSDGRRGRATQLRENRREKEREPKRA